MDHEASTSQVDILDKLLLDESADPTDLPFSLLQGITNHFSLDRQIGKGGFAVVYKGVVGKGTVAVKKLSNTFAVPENKFHEEVRNLIKAKHKNIVRFLGYCADTQGKMEEYEGNLVMTDQRNWLLCFEYVCNGSLDKHITDAACGLEWRERYRIIRGICEGIVFLHEKRILHLDLKPANILLDSHMVPKIADFGLSRFLDEEQTRFITQNLWGTLGYMDPEYIRSRQVTRASDIYSLGVIIMEILTGVRWYITYKDVVESWRIRLEASEGDMHLEQVKVCYKIGIECMNFDTKKRPIAQHIVDELDKTRSPDHSASIDSSLFELHVSLPREQSGEIIEKLAAESLQADVKEHSEILEDAAKTAAWPRFQEGHTTVFGASISTGQDTMEMVNRHGTSNSSSFSTGFYELSILDIYRRTAHMIFDTNNRHTSEQSHFINIFRMKELRPIIMSTNLIREVNSTKVYKGIVDNVLVAVKQMIRVSDRQLENELIIQSQINHKNIACLIGCCLEIDNPILVYEFLPRGSLDAILHSDSKVPLNLDVRLNIVAESAQGLAYLHSQARTKILHGNVQPANILLDDNFIPKISDFGISRLIPSDGQHTLTIIGDMSYIDPVYMQTGLLTEKSDVYSFGAVILELISRKKVTYSDNHSLVKNFLEFHKEGKKATELFDKQIAVRMKDLEILDGLAEIAVECLNMDVDHRPTMTEVAERLLILNCSRRLHARHISADYSVVTDIRRSFVEQRKVGHLQRGVQDRNRRGGGNSSSVSTGFYKLNNLDIFNWTGRRNFSRNGRYTLEKSHFIKIFRKEELRPILRISNLIGKGAFTEVYKGTVDNAVVVVKKAIDGNVVENEKFENEVLIQSQVIHKNIIRLIGCCIERKTHMLVYEFLPRGSLDEILHCGSMVPLNLDVRLTIAAESAQGLAYLHSQARIKIPHGDVKPTNILLDENFMPKITDFSILRSTVRDMEPIFKTMTVDISDICYMDPVHMQTGLPTLKSDVYSFGIVILVLISRKKATNSDNHSLVRDFLEVHEQGKKATELFDKEIAVTAADLEILDCLAEIAMECIDLDVDKRPTMTDVAERLLILNRSHRLQVVRR